MVIGQQDASMGWEVIFFYKDLETVERGEGYAFKQNHCLKLASF
jgi:hypothetical protein